MKAFRIGISALLLLASWPLFYLGFLGFWAVIYAPSELTGLPLYSVASALVVLNAFGTIVSFRHLPLFALAVAAFYLGWAFSVWPFPGLLPFSFSWIVLVFLALTGLNTVWSVSSLRRLGFNSREQIRVLLQALVFHAAFFVALLGWSHPFGSNNLPVASVFWAAAVVVAGLDLAWTIQSFQRHRAVAAHSVLS